MFPQHTSAIPPSSLHLLIQARGTLGGYNVRQRQCGEWRHSGGICSQGRFAASHGRGDQKDCECGRRHCGAVLWTGSRFQVRLRRFILTVLLVSDTRIAGDSCPRKRSHAHIADILPTLCTHDSVLGAYTQVLILLEGSIYIDRALLNII